MSDELIDYYSNKIVALYLKMKKVPLECFLVGRQTQGGALFRKYYTF